jgi:hypothetical protein
MTPTASADFLSRQIGAVAQLGERMTGSHEVRGSIPLGSTIRKSFELVLISEQFEIARKVSLE